MMKTLDNYYIENLALFSNELRKVGLTSGIKDTMDAANIIKEIGLADRDLIRTALCALFAKSKRQQHIFYEAFDNFFVGEKVQQKRKEKKSQETAKKEEQYKKAMEDLQYDNKPLKLSKETMEAYANLSSDERDQIMKYISISTDNMRRTPYYEDFVTKTIEQKIRLSDDFGNESQELLDINDLLYKNISDITEDEIPRVINLIQMLVKKINGSISRDYRRTGKSGRLDYRATIHGAMKTGGYFYNLTFKKRRKNKKKIVILCDVSGSMIKFTQFAIRFVKSMSDVAKDCDIYLFSEDFHKVSPFILDSMENFEAHVKNSGLWGKGTDIGYAIDELVRVSSSRLTSSTILLILSDTKTMGPAAAEASLKKVSRRTERIIWMNPIPESKWGKIKTVSDFKPYCQMIDCSTLNNLARACMKFI